MGISPGLKYLLLTLLPGTTLPAVAVIASIHYCVSHSLPTSGNGVIILLDVLVIYLILKLCSDYHARQQAKLARQHNAIPVPIMRGRWGLPGNIDMLPENLNAVTDNYAYQYHDDRVPIWGDIWNFKFFGADIVSSLLELCCRTYYSPAFLIDLPLPRKIFTTNPAYVKQILATDFTNWVKGAPFHLQRAFRMG